MRLWCNKRERLDLYGVLVEAPIPFLALRCIRGAANGLQLVVSTGRRNTYLEQKR